MDDLTMYDLISKIRQSMLDQIDEMPVFTDPRSGNGVSFIEKTIAKLRIQLFTPDMSELSDYIDKLCDAAYDRGKAVGFQQGKACGIKLCSDEIGLDFRLISSGIEPNRENGKLKRLECPREEKQ